MLFLFPPSSSAQEERVVSDSCVWELLNEFTHINLCTTCNFLGVVVLSSFNFTEEELVLERSTNDLPNLPALTGTEFSQEPPAVIHT